MILYGGLRKGSDQTEQVQSNPCIWFVCVEVLRPSQPNGVMSSAVRAYGKSPKISYFFGLSFPLYVVISYP